MNRSRNRRSVHVLAALALAMTTGTLEGQRPQDAATPPTIEEKTAAMERMDGFLPIYWEESAGRIWLEIGLWDTDVLHAAGIGAGLGSNDIGIDRGQQSGSRVVRFHRVGPKVLMVQPNYRFRASSDNPAERKAVEDAFAPSTLWGFTVAAATGDRVLVDFTPFLMQDIVGLAGRMRPGTYRLDASRSAVYMPMVMNFPENTEMEASLTFVRQAGGGGGFGGFGGGGAFEGVGSVAASAAAATVRMHHSLVKLPELGEYTPRAHDSRAGYGGMSFQDYSAPLGEPMTQRFIRRHRLEKRDPGAAMSEPVEPIVYYLDPGTPEPVRSALLDGARWWNQAFEAAGFIDAFRVELRPEDVSSHDIRYNVINWVHRSTRGWSTGGSITDPRTGEILKGTVTLGSLRVRQDYLIAEGLLAPYTNGDENPADIAEWALARIRQLSAHEVGHTLGLSHNYYDSDLGRISVLDYPHPLITHDGDDFDYSAVYDADIGEWDKVAIRYGYAHFPPGTDEAAELERILDEAWEEDVRFFTNQDVSAHARADQWSNGTDAGAELDRMLDVRRAALERFGERAIRRGRPMARMEEALVPLYLHHRYQVTAAASVLGGLHLHLRYPGRRPRPGPRGAGRRAAAGARRAGARHSAGRADHPPAGAGRPSAPPVRVRPVARTLPALHGPHVRRDFPGGGRRGPRGGRRVEWEPGGAAVRAAPVRSFAARSGRRDGDARRGGRARRGRLPLRGGGAARRREGRGRRADGTGGWRFDASGARHRRPASRAHEVHGAGSRPEQRRCRGPLRPRRGRHPALRGPALRLVDAHRRPAGPPGRPDRVTRDGLDRGPARPGRHPAQPRGPAHRVRSRGSRLAERAGAVLRGEGVVTVSRRPPLSPSPRTDR